MRSRFRKLFLTAGFAAAVAAVSAVSGCETLRSSRPIGAVQDYEIVLAGDLEANYVGTETCLSACHFHDKIKRDFDASTMGAQLSAKSGMPLVDCESCHGPGSLAVAELTPEKVVEDEKAGIQTACNYKTFIDLKAIPAPAQSLLCLKCHTANATFNLHDWNAGEHAVADVSCSDCHRIHAGPDLIVSPREGADMCTKCHQKIKAEFTLPSRHPITEKKMFCIDCHNPHGTVTEKLLREETVKAACTKCHAEKDGPFVYEHADLNEDCRACHVPHGSVNNNLLKTSPTVLCLQCHPGHLTTGTSKAETKGAFYTRCTDCHSQIHGTDLPSPSGKGRFIN